MKHLHFSIKNINISVNIWFFLKLWPLIKILVFFNSSFVNYFFIFLFFQVWSFVVFFQIFSIIFVYVYSSMFVGCFKKENSEFLFSEYSFLLIRHLFFFSVVDLCFLIPCRQGTCLLTHTSALVSPSPNIPHIWTFNFYMFFTCNPEIFSPGVMLHPTWKIEPDWFNRSNI